MKIKLNDIYLRYYKIYKFIKKRKFSKQKKKKLN